MGKDLISIKELSPKEIEGIFLLTDKLKENKKKFQRALAGKTLALIFEKPSNRTRVSFEVGMFQLGGNSVYLSPAEINLGVRESIRDAAKTLSRYVDAIVIRTFEHKKVLQLAEHSDKPVINGLSDFSHPCQALADVYTIREKLKGLKSKTLAFVGDGNNVCNSLLFACAKCGLNMNIAAPAGYEPDQAVLEEAKGFAAREKSSIRLFNLAAEAVKGADVVYTDVWASMGQEEEAKERRKIFQDFQLNGALLSCAKKEALVMHCLPAHRGDEITDEVIDSPNSVVFDQVENRLHVQKAVLIRLLGN